MSFFAEIQKSILNFTQKPLNSKSNPEQKEQHRRYHNTGLQNYTTDPQYHKQHGTGTKTDMKTNGTQWKTQK
jgi:hypothetical protein